MKSWSHPPVPSLPGNGPTPRVFDTATGTVQEACSKTHASLYVCGITPYDATHIGHAATYLAFDTLVRLWLDAGKDVRYVQNVTDVDDPLLERAAATGVDWRELAESQVQLFRSDMELLQVIPPQYYVGVTEVIDEVAEAVAILLERGTAYRIETPDALVTGNEDIYFDIAAASRLTPWQLGDESNLDRATMLALSAERGGDPERPGKRDPLDPLLWRAERAGEPAWETPLGRGRPGWHIECTVIALDHHDASITVNGGGSDLVFPHHEFSAAHATALTGAPLAEIYAHTGMVSYEGEKMSKSLGNLVFVSRLVADGVDPRAIRIALLAEHYRSDWEWTSGHLDAAQQRLAAWSGWAAGAAQAPSDPLLAELRDALVDDIDSPRAVQLVDARVASGVPATQLAVDAIESLLGVRLAA
ncbi:L-cysteine:1D-myo-inositol 2-amino-2-deoxy-alpha-D-glucopyranoside ligase [Homoserinimonas aerilata]|uniref:L-cysteine:1D-myo-inositol 2-amino-2-deoxy-alpha-D-glucopyranoside ligase n=1 Tax=Homoserinimonas aerilata TaxID=1162970 RepID=A0A542YJ43_9MICO|nr:cysteine--1-D-myo-inosityl 2-amino-2-deoxy-alpha-D-glucopyranoside ligase [Homoserinimonas aerilata]TQL48099.1 L-cysteine:1D-myo-inositol 2-amino-2-deoxy-alpha-D-glucopyranoside ligase [Homoserinimonas aerilata]